MDHVIREHVSEVSEDSLQEIISLVHRRVKNSSGRATIDFVGPRYCVGPVFAEASDCSFEGFIKSNCSHMPWVIELRYYSNTKALSIAHNIKDRCL